MGRLTAKAMCGGICGGRELSNLLGRILSNWRTPTTSSSRMWSFGILPSGISILFIAGNIYIIHNHLSGSNTSCRNLLHIPLCLDYLKSIRVWGNFLYLFPSAIFKLIYRNQNWPKSFSICSNVVVQNVTILAPYDSPNTDGIDPGTWTYAFLSLKRAQ